VPGLVEKPTARLLIIDDDVGMRETIGDVLQAKGYAIDRATREPTASRGSSGRPCDAASWTSSCRTSPASICCSRSGRRARSRVIFNHRLRLAADGAPGVNGDAFAYLIKPFEMDHLLATLNKALDRQRLARALRESEERYRLIAEHINDAIS